MDSAKKSSVGPIIAGNCINCFGMVRISQTMAVNSTVRCPHCKESFLLHELLDQSLPPLEVVTKRGDDTPDQEAPYIDTLDAKRGQQADKPERPRVKFDAPKALRDGAKRRRRRRRRKSEDGHTSANVAGGTNKVVRPSSNGNGNGSATPASTRVDRAGREAHDPSQRSSSSNHRSSSSSRSSGSGTRRRSSSTAAVKLSPESAAYRGKVNSRLGGATPKAPSLDLAGAVKTISGAVLAISFAYLLLIWTFKADPLGIASPISKALPFAVPASMHGAAEPVTPIANESNLADEPLIAGLEEDEPSLDFDSPVQIKRRDSQPLVDEERLQMPSIDPDEVFGQEFGL